VLLSMPSAAWSRWIQSKCRGGGGGGGGGGEFRYWTVAAAQGAGISVGALRREDCMVEAESTDTHRDMMEDIVMDWLLPSTDI